MCVQMYLIFLLRHKKSLLLVAISHYVLCIHKTLNNSKPHAKGTMFKVFIYECRCYIFIKKKMPHVSLLEGQQMALQF